MPFTQVKENRKVGKVRVKVKAKVKDIKDKAIGQEQSSTEAVPRKVEEGEEAAEEDEVVVQKMERFERWFGCLDGDSKE